MHTRSHDHMHDGGDSTMEFGKVTRMLSSKLNESLVVYKSAVKPGYVYKFYYIERKRIPMLSL